jgi:hypothetical protein
VGGENCLSSMESANRVVAVRWMEGSVVVSRGGQKRSVIEGILTCVTARHRKTHERSGSKKSKY